ncbi:MAG: PhoX family phosphatase [Hyphomicrobiaceae bacterium]|nr:PhoX family phosphatase [Hyphomicrobiaceae bacterium]
MIEADRPVSVQAEEAEDGGANSSMNASLGDVVAQRLSRRDVMRGALAVSVAGAAVESVLRAVSPAAAAPALDGARPVFDFAELGVIEDETHHVADGYDADVLIRWGNPVVGDAPAFAPATQGPEAQAKQFGYNNDFIGFIPLGTAGDRGLLVVNHEYTNEELMFAGLLPRGRGMDAAGKDAVFEAITERHVAVEMMAHGGSVIEIARSGGKWAVVPDSKYARRITAETEMEISGPARGHALMRTSADPEGSRVRGMINNCAGGVTPWGTWLTCEENTNYYFWNKAALDRHPQRSGLVRYGIPSEWYQWGRFHERFDIGREPNEPHRFGWVVEIDPMDPDSVPVKRTAMGRFKHEGAGNIVNKDGRFVVYQGDDERFDYLYRFVTEGKVDAADRAKNRDLLDRGTLSVARFDADGTGHWLPLIHGQSGLVPALGFADQGEVLIQARLAADMLGATKMDRPEDVDVNPATGKVYAMLTNNTKRKSDVTDAANPRGPNVFGHIIEITPDDGDHAAGGFRWEILVKCGDPAIAPLGAAFNPATSRNGWFAMPDNCTFDAEGRLWVATDGNSAAKTGRADGIWGIDTQGEGRGTSTCFFQVPRGAEMCGPCFTPDMETMFLAVQHPGEVAEGAKGQKAASFEDPSTRWPDFQDGVPPRPSVVAVTRRGGGKIARGT